MKMDKIGNELVYKPHTLNVNEIWSGLTQPEGSAFLLVLHREMLLMLLISFALSCSRETVT